MSRFTDSTRIVFLVHYFPPLNSAGAKRVEALSKYFVRAGWEVIVITTTKRHSDGDFTEKAPPGVSVLELDSFGRLCPTVPSSVGSSGGGAPAAPGFIRKVKDWVMRCFGQLPDPRLPFAFAILSPVLAAEVRQAMRTADVLVSSSPPWPMLLAGVFARWRFKRTLVLDYRDHFSECHEMPGSALAKAVERLVDRALAKRAHKVVTVSEPMARYYSEFNPRVAVIPNGYDPEVIDAARHSARWVARPAGTPLTIRYLGLITPDRIPRNLLAALDALAKANAIDASFLRLQCYGECSLLQKALTSYSPAVAEMFSFNSAVPYRVALELAATADYLLFAETSFNKSLSAQGILTTKLFEYLACGRPIIADIEPSTLAGQLIQRAGAHHFVSSDVLEFERHLSASTFRTPPESIDPPFVKTLSRSAQADQYMKELSSLPRERGAQSAPT